MLKQNNVDETSNMAVIKSVAKLELELPPSCIAFLPRHQEYCLVGTYYLHPKEEISRETREETGKEALDLDPEGIQNKENEETQEKSGVEQKRTGSILLVKHRGGPPSQDENREELVVIFSLPTEFALLDLKFHGHSDRFYTANSTGSISICEIIFSTQGQPLEIRQLALCQLWDPKILVLSISFGDHNVYPQMLGATLSNGEVAVCNINKDSTNIHFSAPTIASHDGLEAWTVAFGYGTSRTAFSGGDDAMLQKITLEGDIENAITEDPSFATVLWRNRKIHGAGVTAILPINENMLLTGSYDDNVRLLDISKHPRVLAEADLGGGVWRLMPFERLPYEAEDRKHVDVLACCMHAGSRIIRVKFGDKPIITVLAKFEENHSMNYGAAIGSSSKLKTEHSYTIVSISFYDKMAFLWKAPVPPGRT
jgi:diphthamide biosynthesis protein 7